MPADGFYPFRCVNVAQIEDAPFDPSKLLILWEENEIQGLDLIKQGLGKVMGQVLNTVEIDVTISDDNVFVLRGSLEDYDYEFLCLSKQPLSEMIEEVILADVDDTEDQLKALRTMQQCINGLITKVEAKLEQAE